MKEARLRVERNADAGVACDRQAIDFVAPNEQTRVGQPDALEHAGVDQGTVEQVREPRNGTVTLDAGGIEHGAAIDSMRW